MAFALDRLTKVSYSQQVQRQALAQLIAGRLRAGDRLPSVREMARTLDISRSTAERIQDGLRETLAADVRPRSGAFVGPAEAPGRTTELQRVRELYAFVSQTLTEARRRGLDPPRLIELLLAVGNVGPRSEAPGAKCLPVLATRDAFECMVRSLPSDFAVRLVHLPPTASPAEVPRGTRYLISGYYLRGRARALADAVGCRLVYVRYNATLLDQAMDIPANAQCAVITRDRDNAETTRGFLASAYPEVPPNRYEVCTVDEWIARRSAESTDMPLWPTITAEPMLRDRVDPHRIHLLHPLIADDFVEELRCLALLG